MVSLLALTEKACLGLWASQNNSGPPTHKGKATTTQCHGTVESQMSSDRRITKNETPSLVASHGRASFTCVDAVTCVRTMPS